MKTKTILLLFLAFAAAALAGAALASENDANLCSSGNAWEGQCTTQRDWEAGWCYANNDAQTCAELYGDVASQNTGEPESSNSNGSQESSNNSGDGASASSGQQATSQQAQQQQFRGPLSGCPPGLACAA